MAKVSLTPALRLEYETLFNGCAIRPERFRAVNDLVAAITANRARYGAVSDALGVPWHFIGVIHNLEAGLDFTRHLHNGDPLSARTRQVPKNRPRLGVPPFTWEQSAQDAIALKGLGTHTDWSLAGTLYQLENYNGWGYRLFHQHVLSPYLWSFSTHYSSGKYVADGTWSDSARSAQCGAAVLLRRMAENGQIQFPDQPPPAPEARPLVRYSSKKPKDPAEFRRAEQLQIWLNTFPGIFVKVDGMAGQRTSEAYRKVTGAFLPGDPLA